MKKNNQDKTIIVDNRTILPDGTPIENFEEFVSQVISKNNYTGLPEMHPDDEFIAQEQLDEAYFEELFNSCYGLSKSKD